VENFQCLSTAQRGAAAFVLYKNTGRPIMNEPESVFCLIILTKNTPQFPFGHGLSYSKFEYSGFELSSNAFAKDWIYSSIGQC
jgi:hypothetical protein